MPRRRRSSRYLSVFLLIAALSACGVVIKQLHLFGYSAKPVVTEESKQAAIPVTPVVDTARKPLVDSATFTQTPAIPSKSPTTKPAVPATSANLSNSFPSSATPLRQLGTYTPNPDPSLKPAENLTIAPATRPSGLFADARALADAGQLVQARDLVNASLANLPEASQLSAKQLLTQWNKEIIFGRKVYATDPNQLAYSVPSGGVLQKIAQSNNVTWELLASVNGISDPTKLRAGQTIKLLKGPFNAIVDKKHYTLEIYHGVPGDSGAMFLTQYPVGLGKDDSTPAGAWKVSSKLKNPTYYSPRGEGVIASGDPRNPLGDFWIGIDGLSGNAVGKQSYGIHGTIEPDSIGKMASMGCIRLLKDDIAMVYSLLVEGKSTVFVKE